MTSTIRWALASLLLSSASAAAQDSLDPVRNLYASAEYEEALTAIGRLKSNADLSGVAEVDRYRALCLIALGRSAEADQAIERTVTLDPLYQPAAADASPRVRLAFSEVRQRLLPQIATTRYGATAYSSCSRTAREGRSIATMMSCSLNMRGTHRCRTAVFSGSRVTAFGSIGKRARSTSG